MFKTWIHITQFIVTIVTLNNLNSFLFVLFDRSIIYPTPSSFPFPFPLPIKKKKKKNKYQTTSMLSQKSQQHPNTIWYPFHSSNKNHYHFTPFIQILFLILANRHQNPRQVLQRPAPDWIAWHIYIIIVVIIIPPFFPFFFFFFMCFFFNGVKMVRIHS